MPRAAWTPQQARTWLESIEYRGMHLGLSRIISLAERLGNPELTFPSILIAGTNGKGSVAAILESILRIAGFRSGLYTSPHLIDWTERIVVDGEPISDRDFASALQAVSADVDALEATPFETLTMAAMWHFRRSNIDRGVIEVGLGGRLDATRLCRTDVAVITSIDVDHVEELGRDIYGVAREKGAIMREGVPTVLGPGTGVVRDVLVEQAADIGSALVFAEERIKVVGYPDDYMGLAGSAVWLESAEDGELLEEESGSFEWNLPLGGAYMLDNLTTALAVISCLRERGELIPTRAVADGIGSVNWPGRLHYIHTPVGFPDLILDVGHNPSAAEAVSHELSAVAGKGPLRLVVAMAEDKDMEAFLEPLIECVDGVVTTTWGGSRARDPEDIAAVVGKAVGRMNREVDIQIARDPVKAIAVAASALPGEGVIVAIGSHMLIGPILAAIETAGVERLFTSE